MATSENQLDLVFVAPDATALAPAESFLSAEKNRIAAADVLTGRRSVRLVGINGAALAMPELIKRICVHTAAALGAEAELTEYTVAHPAVVNDERAAARCRRAVKRVLGPEAVGSYRGTLSGEDFSLFLERVPGVLAFVGVRNPAVGATFAQHSCFYRVDESVLARGTALACQYAVDFLTAR